MRANGDEMRRYIGMIRRNLLVLAAFLVLALLLGYFFSRTLEPSYTARSTVMLSTRQTNVVDYQNVLSGIPTDVGAVSGEIQLLQSNELLGKVVKRLHLDRDPEFVRHETAAAGEPGWLKSHLRAAVEGVQGLLGLDPRVKLPTADAAPDADMIAAAASLQRRLNVRATGDWAPVMSISVQSEHAHKAMLLANAIAEVYINDQLEAKFEATQRATTWLGQRLTELKQKVESSEAAVAAFRKQISTDQGPGLELSDQQMSELSKQLIQASAARAEAEAELNQLLAEDRSTTAGRQGSGAASIAEPRKERERLLAREADLIKQYGADSPEVTAIKDEIVALDRAIAVSSRATGDEVRLRRNIDVARNALDGARAREAALKKSLEKLESGSLDQSNDTLKLNELEREAEADRLIYQNFLTRFKEISQQADMQQPDARLISPAEVATFTGTSTSRVLLTASLLGLALGAGIVILLERMNDRFHSAADLEESVGVAVLSSLPRAPGSSKRPDVLAHVRQKPTSALAEAVRNLRTSLLLSSIDVPPKVVMVTSSVAEEGKSTSSLLLAYMNVRMGRSTIVVDCDLRRPTLRDCFGLSAGPDFLSVLDGSAELEEVVTTDPDSGIDLLPISKAVPQASDILSSARFRQVIETLSEHYDLVVLDVPPVLLVSDAGVVGGVADATVYAVRWGKTPRELVKKGIKQLADYGIRVNGALLTFVDRREAAQYEAYRYGYGEYRNRYYSD